MAVALAGGGLVYQQVIQGDTEVSGNVLEITGTVTAQTFVQAVEAAPAGTLTVRPSGASFTVTGTYENGSNCIANKGDASGDAAKCLHINRADVTIQHAVFQQVVWLTEGMTIEDSTLIGFNAQSGPDNWTLQRDVIDPSCQYDNNVIYNATNWKVLDSTLQNIHYCPNESIHSEALYIGNGNNGFLISGNTFYNNGTTAHIFFTYFPGTASNTSTYPRNGCVEDNTFELVHNNFVEINVQNQLDTTAVTTIHLDPNTNTVLDANRSLSDTASWETACP